MPSPSLIRTVVRPSLAPVPAAVAVLSVLAPCRTIGQVPEGFREEWSQVRQLLETSLESEGIVGGTLWFIQDGQVIAQEFYGLADLETQRPVDENTIFHWASITKTLTGIAIMQLKDRQLLDLGDPIVRYLPEVRAAHNPYGDMEEITIRQLLSHSAGFRSATWPWGGDEDWHPHEPREWDQIVAMMPYTRIQFPPGD
jgi:CubicO group peptidase (beta-lactamase class C family)